jgi:hypothetical protein
VDRDDLLQPVLAGYQRRPYGAKPWRVQSQIYVGFFGGALAVGGIAFANAVMLGLPVRARVAIVALALAAEAALLVAAAAVTRDATLLVRFGIPVAGLIAYGGAFLIQRSADRVYQFHTDEDEPYERLFGAGLVACIIGRIVDAMLLGAVAE